MQPEDNVTSSIRPIIVKTVCAHGRQELSHTVSLTPPHPADSILGIRVSGLDVKGHTQDSDVIVDTHYDVHVWYLHDNGKETEVTTHHVVRNERVALTGVPDVERLDSEEEIYITVVDPPRVVDQVLERTAAETRLAITVGLGLSVDLVSESKLWIRVHTPAGTDEQPVPEAEEAPSEQFAFLEHEDDLDLPEENRGQEETPSA